MFSEDLTEFFDAGHGFAVQALLDGQPVTGIFERPSAVAHNLGFGALATQPTFLLPETPAVQQSTGRALSLTQSGIAITWKVISVKPDGTGLATLVLERP